MENVVIRNYEPSDNDKIIKLIIKFQAYLKETDQERLIECGEDYGFTEVEKYLSDVEEMNGIWLVAEKNNDLIGFVQGIIQINNSDDYLRSHKKKSKDGWIGLLYVVDEVRGSGLGDRLIKSIEDYFIKNECDSSRIKVLAHNGNARKFYEKEGYTDRDIELRKPLKGSC